MTTFVIPTTQTPLRVTANTPPAPPHPITPVVSRQTGNPRFPSVRPY
jgi:hypothetical protein